MPDVEAHPTRALTEARAAVLGRLWGALAREPLPGIEARRITGGTLEVDINGLTVAGPRAAAEPFAAPPPALTVTHRRDGARRVVADPAALLRRLGMAGGLIDEIDNSVANLAMARAAQPAPDGGPSTLARAAAAPDPLAFLEQCVVDGHPLHPCCRTRTGLSPDEVRAYAPEHRPVVRLVRVRVPEHRWIGVNAPAELLVHPWQRDHVLGDHPWLVPLGEVPARPLMSLRTLALASDPRSHVKTAVSVQMTSAVRTVSPAALHNGPLISALVPGLDPAGLTVVPEVAAGAALVDGEPHRGLAMVRRRMPDLGTGALVLPFAALAAPSPADGRPILGELVGDRDPYLVLIELARMVLEPVLRLLRLGIALEAHGQNLLLVVRDGHPAGLLYRDFGGVRISPARLSTHGVEAPPLRGDLISDDPGVLRTKVFAATVSTVLAELVTVAGREFGVAGFRAWAGIAAVVRASDGDPGDRRALLNDPLPLKATTAMRLAADPLVDQWVGLPNPLAGAG